jgi:hypothetical protein
MPCTSAFKIGPGMKAIEASRKAKICYTDLHERLL